MGGLSALLFLFLSLPVGAPGRETRPLHMQMKPHTVGRGLAPAACHPDQAQRAEGSVLFYRECGSFDSPSLCSGSLRMTVELCRARLWPCRKGHEYYFAGYFGMVQYSTAHISQLGRKGHSLSLPRNGKRPCAAGARNRPSN